MLAALIFYEGRGLAISNGKELIAQVVVNRSNYPGFPNSIEAVLKQSGQYGYGWPGYTGTLIFEGAWVNHPEYAASQAACYAAADAVLSGASVDEYGNSWPSNVVYQHSFSNPNILGSGLFRTYYTTWGSPEHFNYA